jgi:hypothetical protein
MKVFSYLDASTDAVTPADLELLATYSEDPHSETRDPVTPRIINTRFGFWINVQHTHSKADPADIRAWADAGFSSMFLDVIREAALCDCNWINLDRDA